MLRHSVDYIFIPFRIIGPIVVSLKTRVLLLYKLKGVSSVANFITSYEKSLLNRDSHFLSVMCSLFPKVIVKTFSIT